MLSVVGSNIRRIDGVEKVAGQAGRRRSPFAWNGLRKVLVGAVAHARIRRIDARIACALPGVLAVVTRDNLNVVANSFGAYVRDQQILATDKVRYAGDMVAAVAATDAATAEEAIKLIDVEYDELRAVFTVEDALKDGAPAGRRGRQGDRALAASRR